MPLLIEIHCETGVVIYTIYRGNPILIVRKSPDLEERSTFLMQAVTQRSPATRHGGAWGERRYSSYSFVTSALDGGDG
jgi:hypothetical protein